MPTQNQMVTCFRLLQSFSNTYCSINLFRYDLKYKKVYILAENSREEDIQVEINTEGNWRFIDE